MVNEKNDGLVIPSMDLLSEMEALEIHGGAYGGQIDLDAVVNTYCAGAKCHNCDCIIDKPKSVSECGTSNTYCGDSTICGGN